MAQQIVLLPTAEMADSSLIAVDRWDSPAVVCAYTDEWTPGPLQFEVVRLSPGEPTHWSTADKVAVLYVPGVYLARKTPTADAFGLYMETTCGMAYVSGRAGEG